MRAHTLYGAAFAPRLARKRTVAPQPRAHRLDVHELLKGHIVVGVQRAAGLRRAGASQSHSKSGHSGMGGSLSRRAARLPSANLAASEAPYDGRAARPRVSQAAARSKSGGRRAANGEITCVYCGSPRRPIATHPSLVGEVAPLLRDDERRRATARRVAGARGGRHHDHLRESVSCWASGVCHIGTPARTPTIVGTGGKSARRSRQTS